MSISIRPQMMPIGPVHVRMTGVVRGDQKGPGIGIVNAPTTAEATAELHRVARVVGADQVVSVAADYRRAALAGGTTSTQWRIEVQAWGTAMAPAKPDLTEQPDAAQKEDAAKAREAAANRKAEDDQAKARDAARPEDAEEAARPPAASEAARTAAPAPAPTPTPAPTPVSTASADPAPASPQVPAAEPAPPPTAER